MFQEIASQFHAEVSVDEALLHARQIHMIERRYSYTNFHRSARHCAKALRKIGLSDVELIQHSADGETTHMDCIMSKAWDVEEARLEIAEPAGANPRTLADWAEDPFCIAQWSEGTGPRGVVAEIVTEEDMLRGADVMGRIVLNSTAHNPRRIKKEVAERGGIGVVSDWTENYLRTPDGVYWNNEWSQSDGGWYGGLKEDEESPIWCISISPAAGTQLRRLIKSCRTPVRLKAVIRTRMYKGTLPTVTGLLPGASRANEEIWLIAHLYEPMPNDNAAGVAGVIETLRTLRALAESGRIPRPERSIRAVFSQEMCGLAAFLSARPKSLRRAIAAVNMDGIAFDQSKSGKPVRIGINPDAQANYTDSLFVAVAEHCMRQYSPKAAWQVITCCDDDNFIVDPTIGIPAHRFFTPEAKYHHNSTNDWSLIDPGIMRTAMTACGTFAHAVATAGSQDTAWLAHRAAADARALMDKAAEESLTGASPDEIKEKIEHISRVGKAHIESVKRTLTDGKVALSRQISDFADRITCDAAQTVERARSLAKMTCQKSSRNAPRELSNDELLMRNMTPKRKTIGPMVYWRMVPQNARAKAAETAHPRALMWTDGKRSLLDIARAVTYERDGSRPNTRRLLAFFRTLEESGYLDVRYAMTLGKADVKAALKKAGVKKNDVVLMHSSLSHCGPIRGGAQTVLDALMEILTPGGTLIVPTNYDNGVVGTTPCGETFKYPPGNLAAPIPWDPAGSPSYTGAIANTMWKRKDAIRSRHPTHSVAAWGRLKEEFVRGHEPGTSACGRQSPYGKMVDYSGKFLYFGCSLNAATFLHALEDWADLGYMPTADVLMKQGDKVVTVKAPGYPEGCRSFYAALPHKVSRAMDTIGIRIRRAPLGFSELKLVGAREFYRLSGVLEKQPDLLLCDKAGCRFCTWARKQIRAKRGGTRK